MKNRFIMFLMVLASICLYKDEVAAQTNSDFQFIELNHGIAEVKPATLEKQVSSPAVARAILANFKIAKTTDSAEAAINSSFGVEYIIKAADTVNVNVVVEWLYPKPIRDKDGEKLRSVKYTTNISTNIPSTTSYHIDQPYEMVKGKWKMNIYLEKKIGLHQGLYSLLTAKELNSLHSVFADRSSYFIFLQGKVAPPW